MITVAAELFVEYDKEIGNSNQINKGFDDYIGDKKLKTIN